MQVCGYVKQKRRRLEAGSCLSGAAAICGMAGLGSRCGGRRLWWGEHPHHSRIRSLLHTQLTVCPSSVYQAETLVALVVLLYSSPCSQCLKLCMIGISNHTATIAQHIPSLLSRINPRPLSDLLSFPRPPPNTLMALYHLPSRLRDGYSSMPLLRWLLFL